MHEVALQLPELDLTGIKSSVIVNRTEDCLSKYSSQPLRGTQLNLPI
jgi:hypothetical protein